MKLPKNICYKVYVPVNYEKKDVGIATRISESMKREIDRIAVEHDRTTGYIIRELMTRGLALYRADGRLRDDVAASASRGDRALDALGTRQSIAVLKETAK